TLGGEVGLIMALELEDKGILSKYNIQPLGTKIDGIKKREDREIFKETMQKIGQPVPESVTVETVSEAVKFAKKIGYPLIVRPAFTLGGTGGGFAYNETELIDITEKGLEYSPIHQCLIERSIAGWKEIEFEVIRDAKDQCLIVCSMENVDPVGVHTGDSIVVAPAQTLAIDTLTRLRNASFDIVRALGVEGGCNVQLAQSPDSEQYYVIEVNPRVSRSSALASKATGYPIAKVTTKIAIGYTLDEIQPNADKNDVFSYEPKCDYFVLKFPRWPFDKFVTADRTLGTQMKATGEVMSIDHSIEAAFLKAVRCLEIGLVHLSMSKLQKLSTEEIKEKVKVCDDERLFVITEALRRGISVDYIFSVTKITPFFLEKLQNIVQMEQRLQAEPLTKELLWQAKEMGFADVVIGDFTKKNMLQIRELRKQYSIIPCYHLIDIGKAGFKNVLPYYYSTYVGKDMLPVSSKKKIVVLGSGPIRIGQGVEFDYCSVHSVWALREAGYETIIINNNPETVSTDFDISDKLYFEPLTVEDVLNVIDKELPEGIIVQFGGQTAINLAGPLSKLGINIIGSSIDSIDKAEDRERFDKLLSECNIPRPAGFTCFDVSGAISAAAKVGYPVMVRPSYVLGGRAMEIVHNEEDLRRYMATAVQVSNEHPVLVDHYMMGTEVEVDAICDGKEVLIPGIMEHVERAGVHSGDSIAVYPPRTLSEPVIETIIDYTNKLALGLAVKGMINVQYIVRDGKVYVIEVNPRSSRTVPFLSKVTGVPLVKVATKCALGYGITEQGYKSGLRMFPDYDSVKVPVFSFNKMNNVDITLSPEMKSTGEVMASDIYFSRALYKAFVAAGIKVPEEGSVLFTIADLDKPEAVEVARRFADLGYKIYATKGTAAFFGEYGINTFIANKLKEGKPTIIDLIRNGEISIVVDTISHGSGGHDAAADGFQIRRTTVEHAIPCLTSMDTARELSKVLSDMRRRKRIAITSLQDLEAEWEE
ncbi:MAG: carbamoyl-phosphate synthase large subunit, partial [Phascolarctobacterium sp.]|nr:carbamoyl-phosphate synthase large subunit [Candidatus Phascolarctobacterium caballi]